MRWTELSSDDYRKSNGDWLPVVGDTVCVHIDDHDRYAYLAQIIRASNKSRYYVRPLFAPYVVAARDVNVSYLVQTLLSFQGYRCVRCKKRSIR